MLIAVTLTLLLVGSAVGALLWLRSFWDVETLGAVVYELAARSFPSRTRSERSLNRVLVRRACTATVRMPSGETRVPEVIELALSPEDLATIEDRSDLAALERDLAAVVVERAERERFTLPATGPRVVVVEGAHLQPGWVPAARRCRADRYDGPPAAIPVAAPASPVRAASAAADTTAYVPTEWLRGAAQLAPATVLDAAPAVTEVLADRWALLDHDGALHLLPPVTLVVGRDERAGVRFEDGGVSRHHARLTPGPTWRIADLGSTNGTYVDGVRLVDEVALVHGAQLRFGSDGPLVTLVDTHARTAVEASDAGSRR